MTREVAIDHTVHQTHVAPIDLFAEKKKKKKKKKEKEKK